MERRTRIVGILCLSAGLAACGGMGKSAEDRINEAMPVGSEVLAAKAKLDALAKANAVDDKAIQAEYNARLQRRAQDCAHDYKPSMFADSDAVREALTDKDCFAKVDATLRDWLRYRRIGILLAASPLRPVPATAPATIAAADRIDDIAFADQAGVAVVRIAKQFQVIDLTGGATIKQDTIGNGPGVSLSPNGRLFAIANGNDTEVREAESGDVIATFPEVRAYQFFWIGKIGAVYNPPRTSGSVSTLPVFLDFASGKESRIPVNMPEVDRVVPIPDRTDQVAVLGFNRAGLVQLQQGKQGWEATLQLERVIDGGRWNRGSGLSADGRTFFDASETLNLLSLSPLDARTVTLTPLRLISAVATPDSDQLLVYGFFANAPGAGSDTYVYSLGQRTLAKVPRDQLASMRFLYIPALKRNGVLDGPKVTVLERIPTEEAVDVNQYLEQRARELAAQESARAAERTAMQEMPQMARARMLVRMERDGLTPEMLAAAQKLHGISDEMIARARQSPDAPMIPQPRESIQVPKLPAVASPVAALAKNADIAAVGVYEGGEIGQARGASNSVGTVQVHVRRTARPLVLSLSSYEPVRWVITLEPGAKLAAVLSSGYSASEVFGAGDARIFRIGQSYAYKRGGADYAKLDAEVTRWTGKRIVSFQGRYNGGSTFVVGM